MRFCYFYIDFGTHQIPLCAAIQDSDGWCIWYIVPITNGSCGGFFLPNYSVQQESSIHFYVRWERETAFLLGWNRLGRADFFIFRIPLSKVPKGMGPAHTQRTSTNFPLIAWLYINYIHSKTTILDQLQPFYHESLLKSWHRKGGVLDMFAGQLCVKF